ncbi:ATP-binding protein [Paenibacillus aurantius]|uniref:histidine kinase n=1 Tax=Paenibacillus aurantius TaxID=2918900 RepID=A0AA96LH04_9BACL|nr:ATP-binding protein [Paenibacillus aurantius]WNQ12828.1 ATP-binding protein [Paenibacillus aurantius]
MFARTRRRLVLLNAAVFLLILTVFSSWLYVHMRYRLFHETDEILGKAKERLESLRNPSEFLRGDHLDPGQDENTVYLFWNAKGELIGQQPKLSFPAEKTASFRQSDKDTPSTLAIDGKEYRLLAFEASHPGTSSIAAVSLVRNLEDVHNTLRALLWDIAAGITAGGVVSVLAGLFLAGRALVPIRLSWEKQQRFVADASHELRTPTAVIHAQTEMLLRHPDRSIEEESPRIALVLQESKRMGKLLDDLLTLARSDSNQLQIHPSALDLASLLGEVTEAFRLLAGIKDIEMTTAVETPLSLWGEEARIRQLMAILLDNALKYTPPSGRIEVAGGYRGHAVYIRVTDNGSGISEEDLPHVFERFYRGDKARTRAEGGTGLGLSIAKWIVEEHGGSIQLVSLPDNGTRVEVLFPRSKRAEP